MPNNVFISYSREDGDFAELVSNRIESAGFSSWIDLKGLHAGEDWSQRIDEAIRDSVALIVVITPAAMKSSYVNYEWAFALGAEVSVVPIMLEPGDVHARLEDLNYLDFTHRESRPWPQLLERLESLANSKLGHSVKPAHGAPAIVQEAAAALDSLDARTREQALINLAQMNLPDADAALIEALNHPLPDVRIDAACHLAKRGDVKALPGLIEGTRRFGWRDEFGRKVAPIGTPAIPALLAALKDPDPEVRRDVVGALQEIGDLAVAPELSKLFDDPDPGVRQAAIHALLTLGTPEALNAVNERLPLLIRDLEDANGVVRYQASVLLERIGSDPALTAVAEWKRRQNLRE